MELKFLNLEEYRLKAFEEGSEPIVTRLIDRKEFVILSATAKTGKSMLALHLAISVASGSDFLDFGTQAGKVLYLQTEVSSFHLEKRMGPMLSYLADPERNLIGKNLYICDEAVRLDKETGIQSLVSAIELMKPTLLILDPFYTLHKKREDSAEDMAPILSELKSISKKHDCGILLIHHQGKRNEGQGTQPGHSHRGSSAFADVPDTSLSLSKRDKTLVLKCEFRNRSSISPIEYAIDPENFQFKLSSPSAKKLTAKEFLISKISSLQQDQRTPSFLKALLKDEIGLGPESFTKAIQDLKSEGLIEAVGSSRNTYYNHLPDSQHLKDRNSTSL